MPALRPVGLVLLLSAVVAGCSSSDSSEPSAPVELRNDFWEPGGHAAFQAGFLAGEAGAARLGPISADRSLTKVTFLFGGGIGTQTVTLRIYEDSGTAEPGALLHESQHAVTPSDTALQELAVDPPVAGNRTVRVALFWQHAGLPSAATDAGPLVPERSWIYALPQAQWFTLESFGQDANLIIRAVAQ